MKIISIDPGIKNLAFCLFEKIEDTDKFKITKWDIINLSTVEQTLKCEVIDKKGSCKNQAKYQKNNKCFCLKHSKKQEYKIQTAEMKPTFIHKQKILKLYEIANIYNIQFEKTIKKAELVILINNHISDICFQEIITENASKIDLITIGKIIKQKFNELFLSEGLIDYVIIENQISPIANRMKTIQGMISQYFIMCEPSATNIQFISASNKLKFNKPKDVILDENDKIVNTKTKYSDRKKLGISKCLEIITNDLNFNDKIEYFNTHKKKDDLADSFLQGMWFISTSTFPLF
jgi:Zn-dependent metalloprotease